MIDTLLAKARQALETAGRDLEAGDHDASVNRSYYAAYYATWAMFVSQGVEKPKTHSGLISEFSRRFVKDGTFDNAIGAILGKLENLRCYADYTSDATPPDKAKLALDLAASFLQAIEAVLQDKAAQDRPV